MSVDIRGWRPAPSVAPYVTLDDRLNVLPLIDLSGVCRGGICGGAMQIDRRVAGAK